MLYTAKCYWPGIDAVEFDRIASSRLSSRSAESPSIDFVDRNGTPTRERFISRGLTVSFSANGVTLTTVSPSVGHITFNDDSATVMITGLSGHISTPGQGTVALSAGRILAVITDDEFQIVAMNGTFSFGFGDLPPIEAQLCDALA